ncbi:hypothetical protein MC7420_4464 [Coleofasciculus chthonoplastes PCC 7420]|uniref:Uncharacterized protein n=1 Tax=Coleofasciculus chthonoplastes PCC 7420 TaxID=118168 RepID=B4VY57_9CYAN|nr:hypothetical protein [Coleofasciculus chthonoplastes]EDX73217.1 hypothetical protein MC7420_4464 [Coleofasciculus chthonoplastes PCC 7420]
MLSALIARIEAQNQALVRALAPINQYRLRSRWLNWEVFIWAFLHGRFKDGDGLIIVNTICYSHFSGQIAYGFCIRPQISWELIDEFGEEVLGVKDFSFKFIPF